MSDFIKLTFIGSDDKIYVRKADIVMFSDYKYKEDEHCELCTTVFFSKDPEDYIRVEEPVEEIKWMIDHE